VLIEEAIATSRALFFQLLTVTSAVRLAATTVLGSGPHFISNPDP